MDAPDVGGNTPLHITVEEDAFDAMNYLLSMYVGNLLEIIHIKLYRSCACACVILFILQWRQCKYFER